MYAVLFEDIYCHSCYKSTRFALLNLSTGVTRRTSPFLLPPSYPNLLSTQVKLLKAIFLKTDSEKLPLKIHVRWPKTLGHLRQTTKCCHSGSCVISSLLPHHAPTHWTNSTHLLQLPVLCSPVLQGPWAAFMPAMSHSEEGQALTHDAVGSILRVRH